MGRGNDKDNSTGGGSKKIYDKSAYAMLLVCKRAQRKLIDSPLTKPERQPIREELDRVKSYLYKLCYTDARHEDGSIKHNLPAHVGSHKDFLMEHKDIVNDLIIKGFASRQIKKHMYELTKKVINITAIRYHRDKFKKTAEYKEKMEDYLNSVDGMRLYNKAGRIEELTDLYEDSRRRYDISPTRESQNQLLKILDQARKESTSPHIYNFQLNQNNMNINGEVTFNLLERESQKEMFKGLPIQEIILSRIAAKSNVSVAVLTKKLHNSYYAQQAGTGGLANIDDEIKYPSELMYDIEDMVEENDKANARDKKLAQKDDQPLDDNEKTVSLRQQIRSKLSKFKDKTDPNEDSKA